MRANVRLDLRAPKLVRAVTIVATLSVVNVVSAAPTHCGSDENVVFSCSAGKKVASLCASRDLTKNLGYMQYRFGPIGAPEMTFPSNRDHPSKQFKHANLMYSGGGGHILWFKSGDFAYTMYSAMLKGGEEPTGVLVQKAGKRVANVKCVSDVIWNVDGAALERIGLPEDEGKFELP